MPFTPPNPRPYRSSTWSDITAAGQPRAVFNLPPPCPIKLAAYGFAQIFQMDADSFGRTAPKPLNTIASSFSADCTDGNALLTGYSQPSDLMGGLLEFEAQFQRVPASWSDFSQSMPILFPGFLNTATGQPRRDPFTDVVCVRSQYDYYVLDPDNIISACSDGVPAVSASVLDSSNAGVKCVYKLGDIPRISKSIFCAIVSGTPDLTQRTNSLVQSGGISTGSITYLETLPYPVNYKSWIAAATASGWSTAVWDNTTNGAGSPAIGQIVVEDSRIEMLAGNIAARITLYALAK